MKRLINLAVVILAAIALLSNAACKPYLEKLDEESKKKQISADINDRVEELMQNAKVFAQSESYKLAAEEYRTIIADYPEFGAIAEVYYNLSQMQLAMDDRDAQIKTLHEVTARIPNHSRALFDLSEAYFSKGNYAKAEEFALLARDASPDDTAPVQLLERIRSKRQGLD